MLVSDYALARVNGEYQGNSRVEAELKNKWFYEADLYTILDHYGLVVPREFIEIARPDNDLIENADYATNEYFFKQNFMGAVHEKRALFVLFCKKEVERLRSDDAAQSPMRVENLLEDVLSCAEGTRLVARMPYRTATPKKSEDKPIDHVDNVQKMIYRMCCIGFVEDYTQNYGGRYFLVKMVRRPDGGYYDALKRFLMRYYAEERADEIVGQVAWRQRRKRNSEVPRLLDGIRLRQDRRQTQAGDGRHEALLQYRRWRGLGLARGQRGPQRLHLLLLQLEVRERRLCGGYGRTILARG